MANFFGFLFVAPLAAAFFGFLIWLLPAIVLRNRISEFRIRPFVFFVSGYLFTLVLTISLIFSEHSVAPFAGTVASLGLVWVIRDQWRRRRPPSRRQPAGPQQPGQTPGQAFPPGAQGYPGAPGYPAGPGSAGQSGYPGPGQPGAPGFSGQPGYPGQFGQPGRFGQPGQPGRFGQSGHGGYLGQGGAPGYAGQSGWPGSAGHSGRPGPSGIPGQQPDGTDWLAESGQSPAPAQPSQSGPSPDQAWDPPALGGGPTSPAGRQPAGEDLAADLPPLDEVPYIPDFLPDFDSLPAPPDPDRRGTAGPGERPGQHGGASGGRSGPRPGPGARPVAGRGADATPGSWAGSEPNDEGARPGQDDSGAWPEPPAGGRGAGRRIAGYPFAAPPPDAAGDPPSQDPGSPET
ncbi:conserved membrane hypothetical protein [Frankia sp. AiPs1]|uniref:hypothetical protein n=1 Tax=Frankia sp. AiPa1 TaxID=573492 RepID=UPI00202B8547|nr:hypothetical protein [Frankia sp. AiPa1]MCL9760679.1 hypothetical protein [Frankia sp. AiPa1]